MTLVTGLGGGILVKAQRAAAQALTPLPHEDKVSAAAQTVIVSRPYAALTGWVTVLALHGGCVPVMTARGEKRRAKRVLGGVGESDGFRSGMSHMGS